MRKIEIKDYYDLEIKRQIRAIAVDGELFDWNIEALEIEKAHSTCKTLEERQAFHANVQAHFLQCFSYFLGRPVTMKEVNEALLKGEIE
jgi:hypothetical protein